MRPIYRQEKQHRWRPCIEPLGSRVQCPMAAISAASGPDLPNFTCGGCIQPLGRQCRWTASALPRHQRPIAARELPECTRAPSQTVRRQQRRAAGQLGGVWRRRQRHRSRASHHSSLPAQLGGGWMRQRPQWRALVCRGLLLAAHAAKPQQRQRRGSRRCPFRAARKRPCSRRLRRAPRLGRRV